MNAVAEPNPLVCEERPLRRPELAHCYQQTTPGSAAEEELVRAHLPLVKTIVGRIAITLPTHIEAEDLYSAGLVGLLNATRHFDPNAGTSFATYARLRIRGAIFDELRRLDWVPRSVHEKARKVEAVIQRLEREQGELPAPGDIARALKLSISEYEQLLEDIKPATFVSLDAGHDENGDECGRHEALPDPAQRDPADAAATNELTGMVLNRLQLLPEMQKKVLALYYFEGLRLREIAVAFGVTESRICQIHAQAILAIKSALRHAEEPLHPAAV
jgi:RNA polymerase sigma factor FliA